MTKARRQRGGLERQKNSVKIHNLNWLNESCNFLVLRNGKAIMAAGADTSEEKVVVWRKFSKNYPTNWHYLNFTLENYKSCCWHDIKKTEEHQHNLNWTHLEFLYQFLKNTEVLFVYICPALYYVKY